MLTYTDTLFQCGKCCSGWWATGLPPSLTHDGSLEIETERNNVKTFNKLKINEWEAKRSGLWVGWKCRPNARQAAYGQPFGLVTAVASSFLSESLGWHWAATWSSHHRHDRSYHIQLNHYAEAFITIVTNWTINHPTPPPCSHTPTPLVWLAKTSSTVGDKRLTETRNNIELHRTSSWGEERKKNNKKNKPKTKQAQVSKWHSFSWRFIFKEAFLTGRLEGLYKDNGAMFSQFLGMFRIKR